MAAKDLGQGLEAIEDAGIRKQVAAGDLSGLPRLALDDEEKKLLISAAAEYPATDSRPSIAALKGGGRASDLSKLGAYGKAAGYAFGDRRKIGDQPM